MVEFCSNFAAGTRVQFPTRDGLKSGTVVRELTKEWPLKMVADEPIWKLSPEEVRFWYDGDEQKAAIGARTCYFYQLNGRNLTPFSEPSSDSVIKITEAARARLDSLTRRP